MGMDLVGILFRGGWFVSWSCRIVSYPLSNCSSSLVSLSFCFYDGIMNDILRSTVYSGIKSILPSTANSLIPTPAVAHYR